MIAHKKNTAYYLSFPAVDSATPAAYKTGISPVDDAYYKDGAGAWTALAITDTATELGATGVYEIDLTAAEMNHDKVFIKFAASGMADDGYMFDMKTNGIDDLATPTNITAATGVVLSGVTHTGAVIPTVTTLTNLPAITANWLTAAGIAAGALDNKGNWNIGKTAYSLSTAGILAIWDQLTSALTTASTIGKLLVDNINATITSAATATGFATPTNITAGTITTVTNLTNAPTSGDLTATMKTSVTTAASSSTPAVTVSDKTGFSLSTAGILAIWDQLTSALTTASTIGKLLVDNINATITSAATATGFATSAKQDTMETTLNAAATAASIAALNDAPAVSAATIADAVWDEPVAGHVAAGSFGKTDADILADTNELQTDDYPTTIAALQTDLDTLTDARGEPAQGSPGVSETILTKIDYLYKAWRNRSTQTATEYSLYNDDAVTVDHKATVSDDTTTADKGEVTTGL